MIEAIIIWGVIGGIAGLIGYGIDKRKEGEV